MRSLSQRMFGWYALSAAVFVGSLSGQTFGTVTGEVKDTSGAIVADAKVTVRNTATNGVREVTTNEEGLYTIPALNPGMYDVRAEKSGFKAASRLGIELQVQQSARVDFTLEVGQVSEVVEVTGAPPLLATENATV